jgi:hypothetical protein
MAKIELTGNPTKYASPEELLEAIPAYGEIDR